MPLLIEDAEVRDLIAALAARLGTTEPLAIKTAVEAELKRHDFEPNPRGRQDEIPARFAEPIQTRTSGSDNSDSENERSFKERLEDFYRRHPMPASTGLPADKAFFDEMSGECD